MNPSKLTTFRILIRVPALISMSVDVKQRFAKPMGLLKKHPLDKRVVVIFS